MRFRLPAGDGTKKKIWSSGGKDGRAMPCRIKSLAITVEKKLVKAIIKELRVLLALDLDPSPSVAATPLSCEQRWKLKAEA
jgi:hypothetical protein